MGAVITAVEAYRQIGFEPTKRALKVLFDDFKKVQEAHKKDDQDDSNRDGKADVDSLTAGELVERKVLLFLRTSDPEQTSRAMSAITSGFLAVLASLKIKFAQAIVVGGAIGDVLWPPVRRAMEPFLKKSFNGGLPQVDPAGPELRVQARGRFYCLDFTAHHQRVPFCRERRPNRGRRAGRDAEERWYSKTRAPRLLRGRGGWLFVGLLWIG